MKDHTSSSILLICLIFLLSIGVRAQRQPTIDSLLNVLQTELDDKTRVDIYVNLADQYANSDSIQVMHHGQKAIDLADEINYPIGKISALILLARAEVDKGDHELANDLFSSALTLSEEVNYQTGKASALHGLGQLYGEMGELEKALKNYQESLSIYQALGEKKRIAEVYGNIAKVYRYQGNYPRALEYIFNSLSIYEELQDQSGIQRSFNHIGYVYNLEANFKESDKYLQKALAIAKQLNDKKGISTSLWYLGILNVGLGDPRQALVYYTKAIEIQQKSGLNNLIGSSYEGLGTIYAQQNNYDSALKYCNLSLAQYDELNDPTGKIYTLNTLGWVYEIKKEQWPLAMKHFNDVKAIAEKTGEKRMVMRALQNLARVEGKLGNYKAAYEYHVNAKKLSDSLNNEKNTRAITLMQAEYDFNQEKDSLQYAHEKEKQFEILQREQQLVRQRWFTYAFTAAFLFVLLLVVLLYRNYRIKQKANQLLTNQKEKLQELDQFKSRFFANISHELRTPLTLIAGPLEGLLNRSSDEQIDHTLEMAVRNTKKLRSLVDDILDLSKLTSSKLVVESVPVQIQALISRIASNYESMATQLDIQFGWEIDAELPEWLLLDTRRCEKILNNLLFNALKYTESGGEIKLWVGQEKENLKVEVSDTGQGIAKEDLPHVFDRYFQSKQPDAPLQGGTGIGLALSNELATLMGGELMVVSELGKGSTFTLLLPMAVPRDSVDIESDEASTASIADEVEESVHRLPNPSDKRRKILFVEDNTDMQVYVSKMLSRHYQVILAGNGKKALELLSKTEVDLVISDVMMPEMDGYGLVEAMKGQDKFRHLPIIMLTALNFEDRKLDALAIGVDDYLTKPFSPAELIARVDNLLTRQDARRAWVNELADAEAVPEGDLDSLALEDYNIVYKADHDWLKQFEGLVKQQLEKGVFDLDDLADHSHVSKRQLQRKLKKITGMTPKQYHQEIALQKARMYLEEETYGNVTAVGMAVGMNNPSRFSALYLERFGKKPAEYFLQDVNQV